MRGRRRVYFSSFDCVDPSAEENLFWCQPLRSSTNSGSPDVQRTWVVEESAQAQAMAEAVNCSGGAFEVTWIGNITVDKTIYVPHGTILNISGRGPPSSAVINGGMQTRPLTVINLYISDVDLSLGFSIVGGAIAASSSNVTLTRTSFFGNRVSGMGGAIYAVNDSSVIFYGNETTFLKNSAGGHGGALYVSGSSIIRFIGQEAHLLHNTAGNNGGAIAIEQSELSWHGNAFFANNTSGAFGGAVNVASSSTIAWIGNLVFLENTATFSGGALALSSTSAVSWSGNATLSYNQATVHGGAIYINGAEASWDGNAEFKRNTARSTGGALYASSAADVSWSGVSTFFNNSAYTSGGAVNVVTGSSVRWNGPNTTFAFNRVLSGSGGAMNIYVSNVSSVGDTTFEYNHANFSGGAVSLQEAEVSWEGTTGFASNTASWAGGALFAYAASGLFWRGVTYFFNNSAERGGAVYAMEGTNTRWTGSTTIFVSNTAEEGGGAIAVDVLDAFADDERLSLLSIAGTVVFVNNVCHRDGGAMWLAGGLSMEIDSTANVTFQRNRAVAAGGAIFITGVYAGPTFPGVSFVSNSAQLGGGVYATSNGNAKITVGSRKSQPITFDRCRFVGNTATATGGAIQSAAGQDEMVNTSFEGNSARAGGALYLAGTSEFFGCSFIDNESDEGAGLAISNIGYVATMQNSSFGDHGYNCAPGTFMTYIEVRSWPCGCYKSF